MRWSFNVKKCDLEKMRLAFSSSSAMLCFKELLKFVIMLLLCDTNEWQKKWEIVILFACLNTNGRNKYDFRRRQVIF